jgi:hypothetical protein
VAQFKLCRPRECPELLLQKWNDSLNDDVDSKFLYKKSRFVPVYSVTPPFLAGEGIHLEPCCAELLLESLIRRQLIIGNVYLVH